MTPASRNPHRTTTLPNVDTATADGNTFFFIAPDRKMPFATLLTNDLYDAASHLARPDTFRLNLAISPPTYRFLFGPPPTGPIGSPIFSTPQYDFLPPSTNSSPTPSTPKCPGSATSTPPTTPSTPPAPPLLEAHTLAVATLAKRTTTT